jgi:DNA polymerase-3 subunit delta
VFYLHGSDEYRKERFAAALAEAHLDPATRDFNFDPFHGSEADLERLASAIRTPPMMAEFRVVLVRETQAFAGSQHAREFLTAVASAPPPGLLLVLLCTPPDKSKARFYADLAGASHAIAFEPPSMDELPAFLMDWSRETFHRELDEDAARALGQAVGADLAILEKELEKLSTLVKEGERITRETVEAAGTRVPRQDRWRWFDTVGQGHFREALVGLPVLLDHGESGVALVAGLGTHLLRVGVALEGGAAAVSAALPPNMRWNSRSYVDQSRGWTSGALGRALGGLLRADELLKSSKVPEETLLETWLLERIAYQEAR